MKRAGLSTLLTGCLFALSSGARAVEPEALDRSIWIAPSYQALFGDALGRAGPHGVGVFTSYEFHVSPRFNLGLHLGYRLYPGEDLAQQVGYGVILRHFFAAEWTRADGFFPYVDYGLLLQQTFSKGRSGSATSHDTRLGGGVLGRFQGIPLFLGAAGHISRIDGFDVDAEWIPFLDVQLGWVHVF